MIGTRIQAQTAVRGHVFDKETGLPVPGASVLSVNKKIAVKTSYAGLFLLAPAEDPDTLIISAINYKLQKIPVSGNEVQVYLAPDITQLSEVIVSANRELQPRSEAPIAIHTISKTTINDTKATRLDLLLNKVPGVFMVDLGNEQHAMSIRQPMGYSNMYLYLQDGVPIRTVGDFNHNALIEINQAAIERLR